MEKKMKGSKLPTTDSIEELASFWDAHDLTDFEGELEEVADPVFRPRRERMTLRLAPDEAQAVEEIAKARGVEQAELLREWVVEKLGSIRTRTR
jgi:predicted DNA binding CopG/RHH family protein